MDVWIRIKSIVGRQKEETSVGIEGRFEDFVNEFFEYTPTVDTDFFEANTVDELNP